MGGEEFLLVLTHASGEGARAVAERIRVQLEATQFVFDGRSLAVTASFGIAGIEGAQVQDFNGLVAQADAALYLAKRLGRNRVEIASTEPG
jgi:diguanylate cyclase (GGDEF)-like protein